LLYLIGIELFIPEHARNSLAVDHLFFFIGDHLLLPGIECIGLRQPLLKEAIEGRKSIGSLLIGQTQAEPVRLPRRDMYLPVHGRLGAGVGRIHRVFSVNEEIGYTIFGILLTIIVIV